MRREKRETRIIEFRYLLATMEKKYKKKKNMEESLKTRAGTRLPYSASFTYTREMATQLLNRPS